MNEEMWRNKDDTRDILLSTKKSYNCYSVSRAANFDIAPSGSTSIKNGLLMRWNFEEEPRWFNTVWK